MEFMSQSEYGDYLRDNGFNLLTGEACNVGMRTLVDMSGKAADIMREFLGMHRENVFNTPMNSSHHDSEGNELKHVGSIMLTHNLIWQDLIYFISLYNGYNVAISEYGIHLWYSDEERPSHKGIVRYITRYDSHPHVGMGNVHAFSGRIY